MSLQTLPLTPDLHAYLLAHSLREPPLLQQLRAETQGLPGAAMQIAPEQGQFMALLVQAMGVRRAIEIGVFTGYSSLVVALALPADGYLLACDINPETTQIARRYWEKAGVAAKIDLRLAPAKDTLAALLAQGQAGQYDFAFIDADKENYLTYYEQCLALLRPGGLLLVDNVLWGGRVVDPQAQDAATEAIRAFNRRVYQDERVVLSMLPLADGLTLAWKRP
ncbi:MAG: class I SAM-dependent methyltransferase [Gloeomargarita sp. SKYBB_i_bin120]|nr:class I SAM-dependent methyltransferase [Gloeomargarita sp. SKYG98]MCS7292321.1 class I SAM-dependent methyltransferase [Gloeomargarita sp. SKYB120]MDW8177881.1 class I SAM-dependent methyltransferase [Gloeomargarita sp. SKYBB_i_bin120]